MIDNDLPAKDGPSSIHDNQKESTGPQKGVNRKDPLHGITLEQILTRLVDRYGWDGLAENISIRCFINNPSIKSSLTFLRKTPWARKKVENLFINEII